MGLLTEGKPLPWPESLQYIDYIKKHGIEQFLNLYKSQKGRHWDKFKWGDELEYLLIYTPDNKKVVKLLLRTDKIQEDFLKMDTSELDERDKCIVHPEYGNFMIESTPFIPYGDSGCDLLLVERNMYSRRKQIESLLKHNEQLLSMSAFPMLGVGDHTYPSTQSSINGPIAQSQLISDDLIAPHPRFATLTENIRLRRGNRAVEIHVPIYRDINTPLHVNSIFMDAMAFGMGNCCVQVTCQCKAIDEARHLYDQLAVLTPIMMALTASTPLLCGKISDYDCRWTVIAQSVDDRTDIEKGITKNNDEEKEKNQLNSQQTIYKSRYDTIDCFLSQCDWLNEELYNDMDIVYNKQAYARLISQGIDNLLAKHIAHLFIRDPLVVFEDQIEMDDTKITHHFETIQSTNWQNVRFKPPPFGSDIGWRVEFRSMEIQFTEFENAAMVVFVTLASRAILYYGLNLYVPISKIDENFHRGHKRNAVISEKFWWRTCSATNGELKMKRLTVKQILCGDSHNNCRGLIPIVKAYLQVIGCSGQTLRVVYEYLDFIQLRAEGKLLTNASWMRKFVEKHPKYKRDSMLNQDIIRDLIDTVMGITKGDIQDNTLLPDNVDINKRYYKTMPLKLMCDPETSAKLLSKL